MVQSIQEAAPRLDVEMAREAVSPIKNDAANAVSSACVLKDPSEAPNVAEGTQESIGLSNFPNSTSANATSTAKRSKDKQEYLTQDDVSGKWWFSETLSNPRVNTIEIDVRRRRVVAAEAGQGHAEGLLHFSPAVAVAGKVGPNKQGLVVQCFERQTGMETQTELSTKFELKSVERTLTKLTWKSHDSGAGCTWYKVLNEADYAVVGESSAETESVEAGTEASPMQVEGSEASPEQTEASPEQTEEITSKEGESEERSEEDPQLPAGIDVEMTDEMDLSTDELIQQASSSSSTDQSSPAQETSEEPQKTAGSFSPPSLDGPENEPTQKDDDEEKVEKPTRAKKAEPVLERRVTRLATGTIQRTHPLNANRQVIHDSGRDSQEREKKQRKPAVKGAGGRPKSTKQAKQQKKPEKEISEDIIPEIIIHPPRRPPAVESIPPEFEFLQGTWFSSLGMYMEVHGPYVTLNGAYEEDFELLTLDDGTIRLAHWDLQPMAAQHEVITSLTWSCEETEFAWRRYRSHIDILPEYLRLQAKWRIGVPLRPSSNASKTSEPFAAVRELHFDEPDRNALCVMALCEICTDEGFRKNVAPHYKDTFTRTGTSYRVLACYQDREQNVSLTGLGGSTAKADEIIAKSFWSSYKPRLVGGICWKAFPSESDSTDRSCGVYVDSMATRYESHCGRGLIETLQNYVKRHPTLCCIVLHSLKPEFSNVHTMHTYQFYCTRGFQPLDHPGTLHALTRTMFSWNAAFKKKYEKKRQPITMVEFLKLTGIPTGTEGFTVPMVWMQSGERRNFERLSSARARTPVRERALFNEIRKEMMSSPKDMDSFRATGFQMEPRSQPASASKPKKSQPVTRQRRREQAASQQSDAGYVLRSRDRTRLNTVDRIKLGNQGLHPLEHAEFDDEEVDAGAEDVREPAPKRPKTRSQTDKSAPQSSKKGSEKSRARGSRK